MTFPARFMGAAVVILDERGRVLLDALPHPISDFTIRRIEDALLEAPQELLPISIPPRTWLE
ncbi:MAG TPA: hypothetical protein VGQ68_07755 [Gaiellaceae bacterium]|nr:hypothetical protein [Gaiellaceae bacterium]